MSDVLVQCRALELGYGNEPVLRGLDLSVMRGEIVAVMGGSGSGKSTLLKALVGLLSPRAGSVMLFGRDLYACTPEQARTLLRRTGMLFQQGALFGSSTVLDNVLLPLRELTVLPEAVMIEIARMKLALVGLPELERRLPAELSGGQRKRVALARASVLDPELVLCDEPTAGLDPISAATIDRILRRFRDVLGVTVVAVTHDVDTVRAIADRAVMLGRGRVLAEGGIDELEASGDPELHAFFHRLPTELDRRADAVT